MRETGRFAWAVAIVWMIAATVAGVSAADREGRAWIGVHVTEETASSDRGVLIEHVRDDSPAERAGLRDGDVIVEVDGDAVRDPAALTARIRERAVGDTVTLSVVRGAESLDVDVELGAMPGVLSYRVGPGRERTFLVPDVDEDRIAALEEYAERLREQHLDRFVAPFPSSYGPPILGVHLVEVTPELRRFFGTDREAGVLVGKVIEASAAETAGIEVGDLILAVDGNEVAWAGELASLIRERAGETVSIEMLRDGRSLTVTVMLPEREERFGRTPRASLAPTAPWVSTVRPVAPAPAPAPFPALGVTGVLPVPSVAPVPPIAPVLRPWGAGSTVHEL